MTDGELDLKLKLLDNLKYLYDILFNVLKSNQELTVSLGIDSIEKQIEKAWEEYKRI